MKFFEIFSQRQRRLRGEVPETYQYETIPDKLRVQVIHIWWDAFGEPITNYLGEISYTHGFGFSEAYEFIHKTLCRKYAMFTLGETNDSDYEAACNFLLQTEDTEKAIDVIEVSFHYIDQYASNIPPDDAIDELNYWFREYGVGYQYESGQIIRVDSQYPHSEVVKPVLSMLSDPMYERANAEFLSAHEHYRANRYEACMNDCLRAFESCIIAICDMRSWIYNKRDTCNRLIAIIFDHKLIPDFMESHFSGLRSALESGVPTLRNNLSGHGGGTEDVPEYIAAYTLHLTASNILFLAKANKEMQ